MLLENYKDKVMSVRTVAGYEILGEITQETDDGWKIKSPLRMVAKHHQDPDGSVRLTNHIEPLEPFSKSNIDTFEIELIRNNAMYLYEVADDIASNYHQTIENFKEDQESRKKLQDI